MYAPCFCRQKHIKEYSENVKYEMNEGVGSCFLPPREKEHFFHLAEEQENSYFY